MEMKKGDTFAYEDGISIYVCVGHNKYGRPIVQRKHLLPPASNPSKVYYGVPEGDLVTLYDSEAVAWLNSKRAVIHSLHLSKIGK
jgi:hypothetical protein